jgi:hypothetical protein
MFPKQIGGDGNPSFAIFQGNRANNAAGPGLPPAPQVVPQTSRAPLGASIAPPPPLIRLNLPPLAPTVSGTKRYPEEDEGGPEQTRLRTLAKNEQVLAAKKAEMLQTGSATYNGCTDVELAETLLKALMSGRLQQLTLKWFDVSAGEGMALCRALAQSKLIRLDIDGVILGATQDMKRFGFALAQISTLRRLKCNGPQLDTFVLPVKCLPQLKCLSVDLTDCVKVFAPYRLFSALPGNRGITRLILHGVSTCQVNGIHIADMISNKRNLEHLIIGFKSTQEIYLDAIARAVDRSCSLKSVVVSKPERAELNDEAIGSYVSGALKLVTACFSNKKVEYQSVWLPASKLSPEELRGLRVIGHDMLDRMLAKRRYPVMELLACCLRAAEFNNDVHGLLANWMLMCDPFLTVRWEDQ